MAKCIKTGCDVFIEEQQMTVRADLHMMTTQNNDVVIIVNYNPRSSVFNEGNGDVSCFIGEGYLSVNGILVAPIENFDSRIYKYMAR